MTARNELIRKGIHLMTFVIPMSTFILPKAWVLVIAGSALTVAAAVETARFFWPGFARLFYRLTGRLLRDYERKRLTGATYLFVGSFLAILFFEKWIAVSVILFVVVSDALAALVGKHWGKIFIYRDRTLEGSAVFFISASAVVLLVPGSRFIVGFTGVFVAFCVDVFFSRVVDDNLSIPLASGSVMQILSCMMR
jgi:dolichol kinase